MKSPSATAVWPSLSRQSWQITITTLSPRAQAAEKGEGVGGEFRVLRNLMQEDGTRDLGDQPAKERTLALVTA
jgi:hypothetical protein